MKYGEWDAQIVKNCWRMSHILPTTWNVDCALIDEREKNRTREESDELGALISKSDWVMMRCQLTLTFKMEREEITPLELSTDELVDVSLGINYVQGFDLNVD
jgi:hypothetical protein